MGKLTTLDFKAIGWYAKSNDLKLQLSTPPTIFFEDKDGNLSTRELPNLRGAYEAYRREHRKAKAKRQITDGKEPK